MAEHCRNIWFQQQTLWFSIQLMILVVSYVSCLLQLHALGSFSQQQPQLAVLRKGHFSLRALSIY